MISRPRSNRDRDDYDLIEIGGLRINAATGDDSSPIMNKVVDPAAGWGKITSSGRTASESYLLFLARNRKDNKRDGK